MPPHETLLAWSIIILASAGVIIRPFRLPEAIWAVAGAVALVLLGVLPIADALSGMRKGLDVYLFLIGMMLIAELAQREGLFDYLAAFAVGHARGSPQRLFLLVYAVGILVTDELNRQTLGVHKHADVVAVAVLGKALHPGTDPAAFSNCNCVNRESVAIARPHQDHAAGQYRHVYGDPQGLAEIAVGEAQADVVPSATKPGRQAEVSEPGAIGLVPDEESGHAEAAHLKP